MKINKQVDRLTSRSVKFLALVFFLPVTLLCQTNPIVRIQTNLGNIDVELLADVARRPSPISSATRIRDLYTNSIIHRSVATFIIQGGGYKVNGNVVDPIPSDAPVVNEFKVSNTRGTIAMAKLEGNPNSATNQWFFNLRDANAANLDAQNGGFTVFGKITDAAGLAAMDRIAGIPTYSSPWSDTTPLINYRPGTVLTPSQFVTVLSVRPIGRAIAGGFGGFAEAATGSYLEIYGTDLAGTTRSWSDADFMEVLHPLQSMK